MGRNINWFGVLMFGCLFAYVGYVTYEDTGGKIESQEFTAPGVVSWHHDQLNNFTVAVSTGDDNPVDVSTEQATDLLLASVGTAKSTSVMITYDVYTKRRRDGSILRQSRALKSWRLPEEK